RSHRCVTAATAVYDRSDLVIGTLCCALLDSPRALAGGERPADRLRAQNPHPALRATDGAARHRPGGSCRGCVEEQPMNTLFFISPLGGEIGISPLGGEMGEPSEAGADREALIPPPPPLPPGGERGPPHFFPPERKATPLSYGDPYCHRPP